jgi:acetolactate synthase-1/2/3 large subunit
MTEQTGGDVVVEALASAGVEAVFGIPSVHNLPIYDALRRDGRIRSITVRHEQGAIGAADGFARTTGRLGVCLSSTGPGAANAMAGQLEAYVSFSPVLHLTGQIDSRFLDQRRGFIHEVPDQLAMLGAASKSAYRVLTPEEIGNAVGLAAAQAMTFPRGPVSVEIPIDFQYAPVTPKAFGNLGAGDESSFGAVSPDSATEAEVGANAELSRAGELIAGSRRPVVWAGGGAVAAGAGPEVALLVRRLGAGLLTSPNGRGIVSEDDPCCVGNLSWDPDVRALCREADLLVAIGTRFQGPNTENWTMELPGRLVQLDVDPAAPGRNYPVEAAIIGDAKVTTRALLAELDRLGAPRVLAESGWPERIATVRRSARERLRGTLGPQLGLLEALEDCLEESTVVVKDATISAYTWGNRLLPVRRARTSIMPNSFAIGLGLPQAVGAAVGSSGRPVILLVGDGGFLLACGELATVAKEQLPITVVVFVDGGYGVVGNIQHRQYGADGLIGVDLGRPDFCGLAASFGVASERVGSVGAFATAVRSGLSDGRPLLLEVDLDAIGPMKVTYTGTSKPPKPSKLSS